MIRDAWPAIEQKAARLGFDLGQGSWTYRQMVCPIFPRHILLRYTLDGGIGDVSRFTAVAPRDGREPVRIVPILRRGFSLYTPAPSNALSIAVFNDLRVHENRGQKVDWLTAGLCYAALTGAQVVLPSAARANTRSNAFVYQMDPLLKIGDRGAATVRFLDVERPQRPVEWSLDFDKTGRLLTVTLSHFGGMTPKLIPAPKMLP